MATTPVIGNTYTYAPKHGKGYGEYHKGSALTAEMQELELQPDETVTCLDIDTENGDEVLVQWVDSKGLDRITAIDSAEFGADFKKG